MFRFIKHNVPILIAILMLSCQPKPTDKPLDHTSPPADNQPNDDGNPQLQDNQTNHKQDHEEEKEEDHHDDDPHHTDHNHVIEPNLESVQQFVDNHCISCHSRATQRNHYVQLSDLSQVIMTDWDDTPTGQGRKLIEPGNSNRSIFVNIMDPQKTPEDRLMPPNEILSDQIIKDIRQWIDDMEPLPPRDPASPICQQDPFAPGCPCDINPNDQEECEELF